TSLNSTTSTGHSGQLWIQHTIRSQPLGGCPCRRKLRLSCSTSIFTSCQVCSSTLRSARQSGKPVWIFFTTKPSCHASMPNRNSTPFSFSGPHAIPDSKEKHKNLRPRQNNQTKISAFRHCF